MRISTGMIFDSGVRAIQSRTSALLLNQQKIASGRRMLSPADDPVAAARALEVNQAKEINSQYGVTQGDARSSLGLADGQLSSAGDLLIRVRELAVRAGNAALSASDRQSISSELRARFEELIGLANTTDGTGQYLFSGYQGSNKPFAGSVANGVVYQGDEGQRALRVSSSRNLAVSDSGNDIFMSIKNGNGIFVTGAQAQHSANPTKATLDSWSSTLTPPATPATSGNLDVNFWVNPATTSGFSTGSVVIPAAPGITLTAPDDTFSISVDGASAVLITVPSGLDNTNADTSLQTLIDTALGSPPLPSKATVSLNASGNLVVTSAATGSTSGITLTGGVGLASLFGTPASVAGTVAGTTFYDLVDKTPGPNFGKSKFSQNLSDTSTALGQAGYLGHVYTSGTPINLSGTPPLSATFDYGASVIFSGVPQLGDVFSLNRSNTALTVTAAPTTATINAGTVTDPVKWSSSVNSGNLELRFWVDASNALAGGTGKTYYDLVDANTGKSAFTGAASAPGGAGYVGHAYTSGSAIGLNSPGTFDFGATVVVSGTPGSSDVFSIRSGNTPGGNGYFVTSPKMVVAANTGSGIVGTGEVLDAAKWNTASNGGKLEVRFWKDTTTTPAALYYDLVDKTTEKSLFTDTVSNTNSGTNTYTHKFTSGDSIPFSGLAPAYGDFGASVTISGTPASGDTFTLENSSSESVFSTLGRLINALESPVGTGSNGNTALQNALGSVINNVGQVTDNILRVRADIGSRLSEIDSLDNVVQDNNLQYSTTLSNLQDVDYAQAITDMTRQQMELQAAQQSFVNISKLSLFNYV